MPIPLQYKYKVKVITTYTKTIIGNKKDTQRLVNYNIEDDDWRHSFIEIENVETGVKQLKNVTNIHSPFYVNPCEIEKL